MTQKSRLSCIQRMLFELMIYLKKYCRDFDEVYLQKFYKLLEPREKMSTKVLTALERHEKVVVRFDFKKRKNERYVEFGVFNVDECEWKQFYDFDDKRNGMCISICFDGDSDKWYWFYFSEKDLRGNALAKVFDINGYKKSA